MKATIDGIVVEGTPEEIVEFRKLLLKQNDNHLWEGLKEITPMKIYPSEPMPPYEITSEKKKITDFGFNDIRCDDK